MSADLAAQLCLKRGLAKSFDSYALSDLCSSGWSNKLDDFVILA
jgi:hypothetical protein